MPTRKFLPPDPRPSKAHPEHRRIRKELEKEHGYGWVPPVILGLIGIGLAYDVTKDVEKAEERKQKQKQGQEDEDGGGGGGGGSSSSRKRGGDGGKNSKGRRGRRSRSQGEERGGNEQGYDDDRDRRRGRGGDYDDDDNYYSDRAGERDGGLRRADMLERGQGGEPEQRDYNNKADRRRYRRHTRGDEFTSPSPPAAAAGGGGGGGGGVGYDYDYDDYGSSSYGYSRGGRGAVMDDYSRRPRARRRSSDW